MRKNEYDYLPIMSYRIASTQITGETSLKLKLR